MVGDGAQIYVDIYLYMVIFSQYRKKKKTHKYRDKNDFFFNIWKLKIFTIFNMDQEEDF